MTEASAYHHGDLKTELIRIGLDQLEQTGSDKLSLRKLAELAGVSKNAPYRHFSSKDDFLGELISWGYHRLHDLMEQCFMKTPSSKEKEAFASLGRELMSFATTRPALYRLMTSQLICRMPDSQMEWPRKTLSFIAAHIPGSDKENYDTTVAAWAYMHGLAMIRIDALFPPFLPQPDWEQLAGRVNSLITEESDS